MNRCDLLLRWMLAVLLAPALLAAGGGASAAILPTDSPEPPPAVEASAAPAITTQRADGQDELIAERIAGIFAEVPSLANVSATVEEGVVTLTGTVEDGPAATRAEAIASRITGVVTVENNIDRDVSVDASDELGALGERIANFTRLLPLLGAAALVAVLIAAVGYALAALSGLWRKVTPNVFLAELIASAIRFIFVIGGIVIALDMLGAGTLLGAVLGGAGVIGIALGFAMRDTVENYVASLMLSLRQPFRANDWVVIDAHEGRVIRLTSRATILMTLDGNHLRIPNSQVFKAVILNYTTNPERRFEFEIGIDADDDPTAARHLGVDVLRSLPFVLDTPEPQGRVEAVGDSNIVIKFLGWINQQETDWYKAKSRAIPAVKVALEQAGFAIPEPIYRLRMDPRSAPLPTSSPQPAPAPAPTPHPVPEDDTAADVRPEDEIARKVDAERAASGTRENDLLDPGRPVE